MGETNEKLLKKTVNFSRGTIRTWKHRAQTLLEELGIEAAELEARILLAEVLACEPMELLFRSEEALEQEAAEAFLALLKRRLSFEPIAYILSHKEFYGHRFMVNEHTLIPRPDTECVVEQCLNLLKGREHARVFDICTGSGAIGLTLAKEMPGLQVIGSDISLNALAIAKKNAALLGVENFFQGRQGDLCAAFKPDELAFIIVANPPYIGERDYHNLSLTVKDFEPPLALLSGDFLGLSFYERLFKEAASHIENFGFLVLEIGYDQAAPIKQIASDCWRFVDVVKDLAANDRCMIFQRREKE